MRRLLLLGFVFLPRLAIAAVTANSTIQPQTPQVAAVEIVSGVAACTASGQPFSCCTGAGTGSGCTTTAASTDAAPTWVSVYTGGANGSKIVAIFITTTDTAAHIVTCTVNKNGARPGGIAITTGAAKPGFASGVQAINVMSNTSVTGWAGLPLESDGNPFIFLSNASDKIDCRYTTAITSGTLLGITVIGGDF